MTPDVTPEGYEFMGVGSCLGAVAPSGTLFQVDPGKPLETGSIVAVVFRPNGPFRRMAAGFFGEGLHGVVKVFAGAGTTESGTKFYLLAQLNPPTLIPVPESALLALHRVAGMTLPPEAATDLTDDICAFDLLSSFFGRGIFDPFNPHWRPSENENDAPPMLAAGITETTIGPTFGNLGDAATLLLEIRDAAFGKLGGHHAQMPFGDALNLALSDIPMVNLAYIRPALDFLILNALREVAQPGYTLRRDRRRWKEYGQKNRIGQAFRF